MWAQTGVGMEVPSVLVSVQRLHHFRYPGCPKQRPLRSSSGLTKGVIPERSINGRKDLRGPLNFRDPLLVGHLLRRHDPRIVGPPGRRFRLYCLTSRSATDMGTRARVTRDSC